MAKVTTKPIYALIACEFSGVVRDAFRQIGIRAYSCDILPAYPSKFAKFHILGDIDLALHAKDWELMIAHPPCTFLCNSGVSHLQQGTNLKRMADLRYGVEFFNYLKNQKHIPRICLENPIPHKYAAGIGKYTQIIHPWQHGHPETKATCLWLKNLPPLVPTKDVKNKMHNLPDRIKHRIHHMSGKYRSEKRSITFTGIANAMTTQWGNLLLSNTLGATRNA